jgi:5,10-methylenetetrahydromethanopterin reductase
MDIGIALPTPADSWKTVKRAEDAGFSTAWFYDTQVLSADIFVAMGATAVNTKRIRLGTLHTYRCSLPDSAQRTSDVPPRR